MICPSYEIFADVSRRVRKQYSSEPSSGTPLEGTMLKLTVRVMSSLSWHESKGKRKTKHTYRQDYTIGLTPLTTSNDNTLTRAFDAYSYRELHLATRATAVSWLAKYVR